MKQNIVPFIRTQSRNDDSGRTDVHSILESICSMILAKPRKYQTESSDWTIDSVIEQNINASKYKLKQVVAIALNCQKKLGQLGLQCFVTGYFCYHYFDYLENRRSTNSSPQVMVFLN